jgi:hypothetical protein
VDREIAFVSVVVTALLAVRLVVPLGVGESVVVRRLLVIPVALHAALGDLPQLAPGRAVVGVEVDLTLELGQRQRE